MIIFKKQKGISIVYIVLITSIIMSIAFGINAISYQQSKTMREIGYSVSAFFVADAGAERALYYINKGSAPHPEPQYTYTLNDQSDYYGRYNTTIVCSATNVNCPASLVQDPNCDPVDNFCINSVGTSKEKVRRALELKL